MPITDAAASAGDVSAARSFWARARELPKADPVVALEADAHLAAAGGDPSTARTHIDAALSLIDGRAALAAAADLRQRLAAERLRLRRQSWSGSTSRNSRQRKAASSRTRF